MYIELNRDLLAKKQICFKYCGVTLYRPLLRTKLPPKLTISRKTLYTRFLAKPFNHVVCLQHSHKIQLNTYSFMPKVAYLKRRCKK